MISYNICLSPFNVLVTGMTHPGVQDGGYGPQAGPDDIGRGSLGGIPRRERTCRNIDVVMLGGGEGITKNPKSTLLADNIRGLIKTKQSPGQSLL